MRSNYTRNFGTRDLSREIHHTLVTFLGYGDLFKKDSDYIKTFDVFSIEDPEEFRNFYLATELFSKYPGLDLGIDKKAAALESFRAAERKCAETNLRVIWPSSAMDVEAVINTAQRKIARLLGSFRWSQAEPFCGFSNGASTRLKRRESAAPLKFSSEKKLHVTGDAYPLILAYAKISELWTDVILDHHQALEHAFEIVPGNIIQTVPKNAKTERSIAKEPDCNMFLQRGIGGLLRQRLKRVGIDLDTQTKNQDLARLGSEIGCLATVDLSSASDTISMELVRLLLPYDWVNVIDITRSKFGVMPDGTLHKYHKVSSMGNGFTFELESLIFWGLSASVLEVLECRGHSLDRRLAVYGDDIIIATEAIPLLRDVFTYAGFSFNSEKSFWTGPFRESCGKHYFRGLDVTPFYIRKPIDNVHRLFWLINQFRRWSLRWGFTYYRNKLLWDKLIEYVPKRFRSFSVPDEYQDNGILRNLDEARIVFRRSEYRFKVLERAFSERKKPDKLCYVEALHRSRHNTVVTEKGSGVDPLYTKDLVPDFARISRARSAVWEDPYPWVFHDAPIHI